MTIEWPTARKHTRAVIEFVGRRYAWEEHTTHPSTTAALGHHGVVAAPGGQGFVAASPDGRALVNVHEGIARRSTDLPVTECHGMSVDAFGDEYAIWIADNGQKYDRQEQGAHIARDNAGQVVRVADSGAVLQSITADALPRSARPWRPTGVTSEKEGAGGRVWVADGYGMSLVHCFSREGDLLWSSDGADSGLAFSCPHGIILDTRPGTPELLVADRGNRRIVALTTDGEYLRTIGSGALSSPSGFAIDRDLLLVTELHGEVVAIDADGDVVDRYGDVSRAESPGWPNVIIDDIVDRPPLWPGVFRSPHGIAVDSSGRVGISEWVVGGRFIVLTPL